MPHLTQPPGPEVTGSGCRLTHSGRIRREDFPLKPGSPSTFHYVMHGRMNSRGELLGGAVRWDFTFPKGDDGAFDLAAIPIEGQWFASAFPGATYAMWLSPNEGLWGVYEVAGDEVLLRGYVSPTGGAFATELHHDPPPRVVRFPIEVDYGRSDVSTVSGKLNGNTWVQLEYFQFRVDTEGTADTLLGAFPAFRQRLVRTRTAGMTTTVHRIDTFFTECLGMVARLTSEKDEPQEDFQDASEIWSLER